MALTNDDKEFIRQLDVDVERRLKLWIVSAVLAQVLTFLPVIFFLGGIYTDGRAAVQMLRDQRAELEQRGAWMQDRERWEMSIEVWAERNGYEPSRYKRGND